MMYVAHGMFFLAVMSIAFKSYMDGRCSGVEQNREISREASAMVGDTSGPFLAAWHPVVFEDGLANALFFYLVLCFSVGMAAVENLHFCTF